MTVELSPTQVAGASFRTVRKGYDPDEVDAFLEKAAKALEEAQQQATAMEARARAAVAKLHEVTTAAETAPAAPVAAAQPAAAESTTWAHADEAETISRTLLLAQRTADRAIAEANAEAERIIAEARTESEVTLDSTREMSARLLEDARSEARQVSEHERVAAESEVQALVARRAVLIGDVDQLERFLVDQRDRLRDAARQIEALCERVPSGLGSVRPPAVSATDDSSPEEAPDIALDDTGEHPTPTSDGDAGEEHGDEHADEQHPQEAVEHEDAAEHEDEDAAEDEDEDEDESGELLIFADEATTATEDEADDELDPTMPLDRP
jgi:DivIVA domain-containing protein